MNYNLDNPTPNTKYNFDTVTTPPEPSSLGTDYLGNPTINGPAAANPLGVAFNTVAGLPAAAIQFGKDVGQGIARDIQGIGLSIGDAVNHFLGRDTTSSYTPTNNVDKTVLGDTTESLGSRVTDAEIQIKASPMAKKLGLDKIALPLAFGGVIGSVALDFAGLGGEEAAIKQLLKETTTEGALDLLTKAKVPTPVAAAFAPEFAKATTPEEVNQLMNLMHGTIGAGNLSKDAAIRAGEETSARSPGLAAQETPALVQSGGNLDTSLDTTLNNKYVKDSPFNAFVGTTDKNTAQGLRDEFVGIKNEQIVRGNQLADEIKQAVPDKLDRQGMFWYKAANGDESILRQALTDPKLADYHPQIEKALDLSPEAKAALPKVKQFYDEAAQVSVKNGSIKGVTENYQNRIYEPTPPKDYVKTELGQNLKQTTGHGKARVFDTEFQAAQFGKKFATTDIADTLSVYNEEMAKVNTSMKLFDAMQQKGIGTWTDRPEPGWSSVSSLKKGGQSFVAPNGIAKGLKAIADPNYLTKIDALRGIQKYQGLVKSVDLSFSLFHHLTFAVQTLSQGGITALIKSPVMERILKSPEFGQLEQDFVKNTGITSKVSANQDIVRELLDTSNKGIYAKVTGAPVIKQTLQASQKMGNFLFDHIQRYLKVSDYGNKVAGWVASHPAATNEAVTAAKKGFAKEINAAYGGLNWESMGITKSELSAMRYILLAPDFTAANASMVKYAFQTGTAGSAARKNLVAGTASMLLLTEGINKILTGHFTDKNPSGHKLEIEIAPNVYISLLRGAQGEVNKLVSNVITNGPIKGLAQYAQGKLAPIPRTLVGLASGVNYYGAQISPKNSGPVKSTVDYAKYIAQNAGPLPFGVSNTAAYIGGGKATPAGVAAMTSGVGRYAPGSTSKKAKYNF